MPFTCLFLGSGMGTPGCRRRAPRQNLPPYTALICCFSSFAAPVFSACILSAVHTCSFSVASADLAHFLLHGGTLSPLREMRPLPSSV